jgi:thioredoxin reductase
MVDGDGRDAGPAIIRRVVVKVVISERQGNIMYDLIVIGGGPAALAAIQYAHGKRLKAVMLCEALGGKVDWLKRQAGAEPHQPVPGTDAAGPLLSWMKQHMEYVIHDRVRSVTEGEDGFEVTTDEHGICRSVTVVVATGASPLYLHVPGAARLLDHGLHYSLTTHAFRAAGKAVAVIGVTPRSVRGAAELVRTAEQVYLIANNRAPLATPLGCALWQQPNVEVIENATFREVLGADSVEAIFIETAGHGRRITVQQLFVDLGLAPNSALVQGLVETDANGFIRVDAHNVTSMPGLFAAGDVTTAIGEHIAVAAGDGVRAAQSAYDYVLARELAVGVKIVHAR